MDKRGYYDGEVTRAPQQECNTKADDPYAYAQQQANCKSTEPIDLGSLFTVALSAAEIRRIVRHVPTIRPVLEAAAPDAFTEVVNTLDVLVQSWGRDCAPESEGRYKGLGLTLPLNYIWSLEPDGIGLGQTLVARLKVE